MLLWDNIEARMKPYLIVTIFLELVMLLSIQLARARADMINPNATSCGGTDVYRFQSDVETFEINCTDCSTSEGQCSWMSFADRGHQVDVPLSSGSLLSWNKTTIGYGQYTCVNSSGHTLKNVLILPEGISL